MDWKIVSIMLIVLLVGSLVFGAWQYMENQHLVTENDALKQQIANQASQLQTLDEEKRQLQTVLNQTNAKITELDATVATLQQQVQNMTSQIEKLREQLKLRDYTTIGLTFLWTASLSTKIVDLSSTVKFMNRQWDPLHIYFFIYHAVEADYLPDRQGCNGTPSWLIRAWNMYPGNDIPIAIFNGLTLGGNVAGCTWPDIHVIAVTEFYGLDIGIFTHELCHVFGISDEAMGTLSLGPIYVIPSSWYGRLETGAEWFQMSLPEGY